MNILSKIYKKLKKLMYKKNKENRKCMDCNWCLTKNGDCEDCSSRLCNEPRLEEREDWL